jgi:hypothetical protein
MHSLSEIHRQPPPRASVGARLRIEAGYRWRNGTHPALTGIRTLWDTGAWNKYPAVQSDISGLTVSYAGVPEGLRYSLEFIEGQRRADDDPARRDVRRVKTRDLRDPERLSDSDILILGTSTSGARLLPTDRSLVLPFRVHFIVDMAGSIDQIMSRLSKSERKRFSRSCREHEWSWHLVDDASAFDYFYDRIYLATMHARYGSHRRVESKDSAYECLFRKGRLFMLRRDGELVGGRLCHWDRRTRTLTSRLIGVVGGHPDLYVEGIIKMMHVQLIKWAHENRVDFVDLQGTEPFLSKGTYQSKRLFGTRVAMPPNHFGRKRLWLHVRRDTAKVRDFLVANPFLTETEHNSVEAVYFFDGARAARTDYAASSPGVSGTRFIDLDEFLGRSPRPPLAGEVSTRAVGP